MPKVKLHETDNTKQLWFFCPGCQQYHAFTLKYPNMPKPWTWNGDLERPSFSPSLLCNGDYPESRCHSWVEDGMIRFYEDSFHDLKGKTVELTEVDWNW